MKSRNITKHLHEGGATMGMKKYRIVVSDHRNPKDGIAIIRTSHANGVRAARKLYDRALQASARFGYLVTAFEVTRDGEIRTSL